MAPLGQPGGVVYLICGQSGTRDAELQQQVYQVERRRAAGATEVQSNVNPFIDDAMLVIRIEGF